jgi:DNA-binding XRE family transcriptional regulator
MSPLKRLTPEDTLTKQEAARLAGVTPRTIARWLADDEVPLTKYWIQINRVAVSKSELKDLISGRALDAQA